MVFEWGAEKSESNLKKHGIEDKIWTAIFTIREGAVRIISVRRSRPKEKKIFEKETLSRNSRRI